MRTAWIFSVAAAAVLLGPLAPPVDAQDGMDPREEARLLREATARESVGDFQGAERTLEELLERKPTSPGALFALDRVLRAQGRPLEVLEAVDAFLAEEPGASGPRYLKLRVLDQADSLPGLEQAAVEWIEAAPDSPDPYREVARVFEDRFGPERALEILRRGRRALGGADALAVELGDVLASLGDVEGAAREWAAAMGAEGTQFASILRRVDALESPSGEVARLLVQRLLDEPTTPDRRRAAARIAVEEGLEEESVAAASGVVDQLSAPARRGFLADLARRAESRSAHRVALWAYQAMAEGGGPGAESAALSVRISDAALAVGDTALALESRGRVVDAYPPESSERRRALAALASLELVWSEGDSDGGALQRFRSEYPGAQELDALVARLARRLQADGDTEAARAALEGVQGPHSALERAYLDLESDPAEAAAELIRAVAVLDPAEATDVIQLVAVLNEVSPEAGEVAAAVAARAHRGESAAAVEYLEERLDELPDDDRAPLLALTARVADRGGLEARGARLRERLVRDHGDALEAPEAMLALARYHLDAGRGPSVAAELLERLILERPESAVVPDARRELDRLREGGATPEGGDSDRQGSG